MIIFITGPSGVGKSTLRDHYCRLHRIPPISAITTRPSRIGESEIHKTVTKEAFDELLDNGRLCLISNNHGFWYAYLKNTVMNRENTVSMFEVDSYTAICEKSSLNAKIIRVVPSCSEKGIAMIRLKRDNVRDRLTDYREQLDEAFISGRHDAGDIIFLNDYTHNALKRFDDLVNGLVGNFSGERKSDG